MTRRLSTPKPVSPVTAVQQAIEQVQIEIGFAPAQAPDTGSVVALDRTNLMYRITEFDTAGIPVKHTRRNLRHTDWPPQVVAAVRQILAFADSDGQAQGLIAAGTHTDDV